MNKIIALILLASLLIPSMSIGETHVSGEITTTTWTLEGSPYILDANTMIPAGNTLTINPGVVVLGSSMSVLEVSGNVIANGIPDHQIVFSSLLEQAYWDGLDFIDATDASEFEHCVFENAGTYNDRICGGAMNVRFSEVHIDRCVFRHNDADGNSGSVYLYHSTASIRHSFFYNNTAGACGTIGLVDSDMIFEYNLVTHNESQLGGAVYFYSGNYEMDHCTFACNQSSGGAESTFHLDCPGTITNSIIVSAQPVPICNSPGSLFLSYACVSDDDLTGNNIFVADPLFVNQQAFDFHLLPESPCIDAGDPDYPHDPDGSVTDLGCFPFGEQPNLPIFLLPETIAAPGSTINIPLIGLNIVEEMGVIAFEVSFDLPWEYLEVNEVFPAPEGPITPDSGWMLEWHIEDDVLNISAAGPIPINMNGPLLGINTSIDEGAPIGETAVIDFTYAMLNEGQPPLITENGILHFVDVIFGDVSLDGEVHAFDASLILSYLAGMIELNEQQQLAGDVSGDGQLSPLDAGLILAYTVGAIDEFPVQNGFFWAAGNATPSVPVDATYDENGMVSIPLYLNDAQDILSARLQVHFDKTCLDLVSVTTDDQGGSAIISSNDTGADIFLAKSHPFQGEGVLLVLNFQSIEETVSTEIRYNSLTLNEFGEYDQIGETYISLLNVDEAEIPLSHGLVHTWPNPFNSTVMIQVHLNHIERVDISIYDSIGRLVENLAGGNQVSGDHIYSWNASNMASGTYFAQISVAEKRTFQKLMLIK